MGRAASEAEISEERVNGLEPQGIKEGEAFAYTMYGGPWDGQQELSAVAVKPILLGVDQGQGYRLTMVVRNNDGRVDAYFTHSSIRD